MPNELDFARLLERIAELEKRLDDLKGVDVPGSTLFAAGRIPYAASNGVLTSSADLTFAGDTIQPEPWIASTLLNSWVNYTGGHVVAGYYKDPTGIVHLKGLVKDGTIGAGIFALPAGYRPAEQMMYVALSYTGAAYTLSRLDITTGGTVLPVVGSNGFYSISGISFRAA